MIYANVSYHRYRHSYVPIYTELSASRYLSNGLPISADQHSSFINHQSCIIKHQPTNTSLPSPIINRQPSIIDRQSTCINHRSSFICYTSSLNMQGDTTCVRVSGWDLPHATAVHANANGMPLTLPYATLNCLCINLIIINYLK